MFPHLISRHVVRSRCLFCTYIFSQVFRYFRSIPVFRWFVWPLQLILSIAKVSLKWIHINKNASSDSVIKNKRPMGHNAHLLLQVNQVIYSSFPISLSSFKIMAYSFWDILLTRLKCWTFQRAILSLNKKYMVYGWGSERFPRYYAFYEKIGWGMHLGDPGIHVTKCSLS